MNNLLSNRAVYLIVFALASALVVFAACIIPILLPVAIICAGVFTALVTVKYGKVYGGVSAIVSWFALFFILGGWQSACELTLVCILPGLAVGACARESRSVYASTLAAGVIMLLALMLSLTFAAWASGADGIWSFVSAGIDGWKQSLISSFSMIETGGDTAAVTEMLNSAFDGMKKVLGVYIPSILLIVSLITGYIQSRVQFSMLKKLGLRTLNIKKFSEFKVPKSMCYIAAFGFILRMISGSDGVFSSAMANLVLVLYFLIAVSGFSLVDFKLKAVVPVGGVRVLIYVFAAVIGNVLMSFVYSFMVMLGMIDGVLNFRHISGVGENGGKI